MRVYWNHPWSRVSMQGERRCTGHSAEDWGWGDVGNIKGKIIIIIITYGKGVMARVKNASSDVAQ